MRRMRKYQKRLRNWRSSIGTKIWYFIHQVSHTPSTGDHRFEVSLDALVSGVSASCARKRYGKHVRHEVEFVPHGVEHDPVEPVAEVTACGVSAKQIRCRPLKTYVHETSSTLNTAVFALCHCI